MDEKREVLKSGYDYIEALYLGIKQVTEHFKEGQSMKGQSMLAQILEGLNWLVEVISLTKDIQVEVIDIEELIPMLSEIIEGLQNNDEVLINDILQYEIAPILEAWYDKIGAILEGDKVE